MSTGAALRIAVVGADPDTQFRHALIDAGAACGRDLTLEWDHDALPDVGVVLGPNADRAAEHLLNAGVPVVAVGHPIAGATVPLPGGLAPSVIASVIAGLASQQRRLVGQLALAEQCQFQAARQLDELHEEMILAAGMQQEFIPRESPSVHRLELGTLVRPSSFVSGDIYRVERVDDRHVALLVADAVGHGLSAGLLTMFLCSQLTLAAHDGVRCPARILSGMNRALLACAGRPKLATAACAIINEFTGEVTLASAGHPRPVLVGEHGPRALQPEGMLLGVFPEAKYESCSVQMHPGDSLIIFTDGLDVVAHTEAPAPPGAALVAWLGATFSPERTVEEAIAAAQARLDCAIGSLRYPDDITIAVARFMGAPAGSGPG
jgi:serine phosphatase RsbU (regulator of sigma subunit)